MEPAGSTAIFLSYASQDAEAARRIAEALRAGGLEVWFDQSELRGGDAWDQRIRRQIKECALFLPVISAATQQRSEGYFRREWNLAAARVLDMAKGRPFLIPIVIDGTRDSEAIVPDEFVDIQWTRLPGGETPADFVRHLQGLLAAIPGATPAPTGRRATPGVGTRPGSSPGAFTERSVKTRWRTPALAGGPVALAALLALAWWLKGLGTPTESLNFRSSPLTARAGRESHPSFNPDGSQVAFSWNGEKQDNFDIYVQSIGGGPPVRLTTDPAADRDPVWSPDGSKIAFLRQLSSRQAAVIWMPALGGPEREIGRIRIGGKTTEFPYRGSHLCWTRQGESLIVAAAEQPNAANGLFRLSLSTGERTQLLNGSCLSPALSPDGRSLAFLGKETELHVAELAEDATLKGAPRRLTALNQLLGPPAWTPDGREILFSAGTHHGTRTLWRMAPRPDSTPQRVPIGEDSLALAIARTGRRLAYARINEDTDIWRLRLRGPAEPDSPPERFISSVRADQGPRYSPDGTRVAFQSQRSGTQEIWVANADGKSEFKVTDIRGPKLSDPRWAADGQSLVFHTTIDGVQGVWSVPVRGGRMNRLLEARGPGYSRSGEWLYYVKQSGGQLWKMPRDGGAHLRITKGSAGVRCEESHDGRFLYYSRGKEIWRVPAGGGEETRVLPTPLSHEVNFTVADRGLYMISATGFDAPAILYYFDFATKQLTTLQTFPRERWAYGLTISPDGKSILYAEQSQHSSLILVENFR